MSLKYMQLLKASRMTNTNQFEAQRSLRVCYTPHRLGGSMKFDHDRRAIKDNERVHQRRGCSCGIAISKKLSQVLHLSRLEHPLQRPITLISGKKYRMWKRQHLVSANEYSRKVPVSGVESGDVSHRIIGFRVVRVVSEKWSESAWLTLHHPRKIFS